MQPPVGTAPTTRRALRFACFAVAYGASIVLGRATVADGSELALFWPAAGVSAWWALTTVGRREVLLVGLVVAVESALGNAMAGTAPLAAVLFGLASLTTALGTRAISVFLAQRMRRSGWYRRPAPTAEQARRVESVVDIYRLLIAALVASTAGAAVGMLGLLAAGGAATGEAAMVWVVRSVTAVVVIALPMLAARSWYRGSMTRRRTSPMEVAALFVVTFALQWLVFGPDQPLPLVFLPFALLFWSATRMSTPVAGLHGAVLACSTLALVSLGWGGPIKDIADALAQALTVQAFMMLATGLALLVSAAICEQDALSRTLSASERHAREQATSLTEAKAKAERLLADSPNGVAVLDLAGRVRQANTALAAMVGLSPTDLVGRSFPGLSPAHADAARAHLEQVTAWPGSLVACDWTILRDREELHVALSSRLLDGHGDSEDFILVNLVDLSERRRYEQRLAHLADHDVLTGLLNRRRFDEAIQEQVERCRRYGYRGAMLLLDLDQFKEVNDTRGHGVGDQMLIDLATILRRNLRANDVIARLGGDEFAVLLPEADRAAAETVAAGLVKTVRNHAATLSGAGGRVTASIGVVTFAGAFEHDEDPLTLADMLMYDAKENGRDQYAILDDEHFRAPRSGARLAWRNRIEQALEHDRFELYLQPILDLRTDRITCAEALIRLVDHGSPVPPSRFLSIAERAGLAPRVDAWVVRHAVAMLARLREVEPDFQLEVNLSGHSIGDPVIEAAIIDALAAHQVDPRALILEVTETAAVADVPRARRFAERMTAIGARFALDDFGAGFGSFYYLKHLVFDFVKIDGEFVANAANSRVDRIILRSIVGIAKELDKQTVAEFVGDAATLAVVREQHVDLAQGHLIGAAVAEPEFVHAYLHAERARTPTRAAVSA